MTDRADIARWQGLRALIGDAIEHGASAIERVHLETGARPFAIAQQFPALARPAQELHEVHDTLVSGVYTSIRLVNRFVGQAVAAALDALPASPAVPSRPAPEQPASPAE